MLTANPLRQLMVEKELSIQSVALASGLSEITIFNILEGKNITQKNINLLCKMLNCQPCDIIEYVKTCDYCKEELKEFNYCPMCGRKL